jgi:hypothetical protein
MTFELTRRAAVSATIASLTASAAFAYEPAEVGDRTDCPYGVHVGALPEEDQAAEEQSLQPFKEHVE